MPFVLAAALAAAPTLAACTWDRPGHNPFMGDVVAAVDRYQDIPAATRATLKARMARRQYDEIATIRRDSIDGRARYAPEIRDMHFGQGQLCRSVTRARWTDQMQERGLVYCEDGHCILVPTVCRNVSRIQRLAPAPATGLGPGGPGMAAGPGGQAAGPGGDDPAGALVAALESAPPGAGLVPPAGDGAALPGSFGAAAGLAVLVPAGAALLDGGEPVGPALAGAQPASAGGEGGPGTAGGAGGLPGWGAPDAPWLGPTMPAGGGGVWVTGGGATGPANPLRPTTDNPRELPPPAPPWLASPSGVLPPLLPSPVLAVAEPGTAGLLAGGLLTLAGAAAWRRRRAAPR